MNTHSSVVLVFKHDGLGSNADAELSAQLAEKLLVVVDDSELQPAAVCFYTEGVKLCCQGSQVLRLLRRLEARKIPLLLCRTSLESLELTDQVEVGIVAGMKELLEAMWSADSVLYL